MKITFTPQERAVAEEAFQQYTQVLTILAKLKGVANRPIQVAEDRSGFILPDEEGT